MPPVESLKDNTALSIALGTKTKELLGSTKLCGSSQKCLKTLLSIETWNNAHHIYCRKKKKQTFLVLFPTEMEEAAVLGNRLKLVIPLQMNPTQNYCLKSARKPAQVSWLVAVLPMLIFCISHSCVCLSNGCAWEDFGHKGSLCH